MGKKSTIRDTSRDYAEFVPIPEDIKKKFKHMRYDTCLHIVIYGEPFSDSRPRVNQKTMGVALINMNKFKVVFKDLYNRSELLQNLTIVSPFHMKGKFYKSPTKADLKFIKSKKVLSKLYESEKLADISIKDTDNMLKIHNDILFEPEFRITLDDAWNGGFDDSEKFLSEIKVDRKNHNYNLALEYLASLYILSKCKGFLGGMAGGTRIAYLLSENWQYLKIYDLGQYGRYNSFFEKIFSIKNVVTNKNKHKVFTILGVKFRVKQKRKGAKAALK